MVVFFRAAVIQFFVILDKLSFFAEHIIVIACQFQTNQIGMSCTAVKQVCINDSYPFHLLPPI